jgi:hypothetical protein
MGHPSLLARWKGPDLRVTAPKAATAGDRRMIAFQQLNNESIAHHRTSMGLLCSAAFRFSGRSGLNVDLKPGQVRRNAGTHLDMPALPTMRRLSWILRQPRRV